MPASFDLRRLRYFVTVAGLGSVTRAAEVLHIAQPALSQHIRALETDLGVKLLDRGPRGVALTEAGRRLQSEARDLLAGVKGLLERVRDDAREPEGEVVIGVSQTVGSLVVAPLLEAAARKLPRVRIQVREMLSGLIPELVRSGALDFALSYDTPGGNGVDAITVLSEDLCLVGRRRLVERHLGTRRGATVRFEELAGLPLYLSRRTHVVRETLERAARRKGFRLKLAAEVDSLYIMKELALAGAGFCVLSRANVRREFDDASLHVARIVAPAIRRDICFLRRHAHALPRASAEVATLAAEVLSGMVEEGAWSGTLRAHAEDVRRLLG